METANGRQTESAHRPSSRTPKDVGAKTLGGREPDKTSGCKAECLPSCTQRLLGTSGHARQVETGMNG